MAVSAKDTEAIILQHVCQMRGCTSQAYTMWYVNYMLIKMKKSQPKSDPWNAYEVRRSGRQQCLCRMWPLQKWRESQLPQEPPWKQSQKQQQDGRSGGGKVRGRRQLLTCTSLQDAASEAGQCQALVGCVQKHVPWKIWQMRGKRTKGCR